MDKEITERMRKLRKKSKVKQFQPSVNWIWTGGNTYQLYFATVGCNRACSMCDYGFCDFFDEEEAEKELEELQFPENIEYIVLEASGSFLDEREVSKKLRRKIYKKISYCESINNVIIETHYTTITDEVLEEIDKMLSNKQVEFEFGVESVNPDVLILYNKDINFGELLKVIYKSYKHGIYCNLNFITGAPMLSEKEQIQDTLNSVKWTIKNCPKETTCVLFPIHVKTFTLLGDLYRNGKYKPINHWEFIEVLDRVPVEYLERISIAWWGNRDNIFDGKIRIVYPYSCDECYNELQDFYGRFYIERNGYKRKEMLKEIKKIHCKCREEFLRNIERKEALPTIKERFETMKQLVEN